MSRLLNESEYIERYVTEKAYAETCEKFNVLYLSELNFINRSMAQIHYNNLLEKYKQDLNIIQYLQFYFDRMISGEIIVC